MSDLDKALTAAAQAREVLPRFEDDEAQLDALRELETAARAWAGDNTATGLAAERALIAAVDALDAGKDD